jgi:uncharacterized membrane protein YedE/YeeE
VMLGAIPVYALAYFFLKKRSSPLLDTKFSWPTKKDIDARLIIGSALFGIGWGLSGFCPGPAIVNLAAGKMPVVIFVFFMLVGLKIAQNYKQQ